jgi:transmembrane protein 33
MGGEADASAAGDPQRLKRIGAAAYNYQNDAWWAGYWPNVLVPPHLASRPDVVDHFKRKFYQRYIVSLVSLPAPLVVVVVAIP